MTTIFGGLADGARSAPVVIPAELAVRMDVSMNLVFVYHRDQMSTDMAREMWSVIKEFRKCLNERG